MLLFKWSETDFMMRVEVPGIHTRVTISMTGKRRTYFRMGRVGVLVLGATLIHTWGLCFLSSIVGGNLRKNREHQNGKFTIGALCCS